MMNRSTFIQAAAVLGAIACVLAFVVITPYETDSPWLATAVQRYLGDGVMRLGGLPSDAIFGRLLIQADSLLYRVWPEYPAIRWVQALAVLLLLPVCANLARRLTPEGEKGMPGLLPVLFCLVMVSSGLLLDGRPEGVLVFFQAMTLWALVRYLDTRQGGLLVMAAMFVALGAETHPNGVLPALYIAVALFMARASLTGRALMWVLAAALTGVATLALGLLWGKGLGPFMTAFGEVARDGGHGYPPYKEYARYLSYLRRFPLHFLVVMLGLVGLFRHGISSPVAPEARALRFLQACALATLVFLVLMPAKWEHYVAALYPFALLGLYLAVRRLQTPVQRASMLVAAAAVGVSALLAFQDNDAAHRLLKLPTERGRILAALQERLRGHTVLGPAKLYFYMPANTDYHLTEGAAFRTFRDIEGLDWVLLDPLVDVGRFSADIGHCLRYDMAVVLNRSHYNAYRISPCPADAAPDLSHGDRDGQAR